MSTVFSGGRFKKEVIIDGQSYLLLIRDEGGAPELQVRHFFDPLTLYHTLLTFNDPKEEGFGKHCGKRRQCWLPAFSPFPTTFSTHTKMNFKF